MATHRSKVEKDVKLRLREEAGNKCANPGCPAHRTELHHIRAWAVYRSHDHKHMIAVCPSCHDAIHQGSLKISDETLYRWKSIAKPASVLRDHIYVEPADDTKLLLGSVAVTAQQGAILFKSHPSNRLSFTVRDEEILLLNLAICTLDGSEVLRIVDNYVKLAIDSEVQYSSSPGHISVFVPRTERFIPDWAVERKRRENPEFGVDGLVKALELEVIEPGLVRVEGIWATTAKVIIVDDKALSFITPGKQRPLSFVGGGPNSVLQWCGPTTTAMFGF